MSKAEYNDEYEYHCSNCQAVINEHDKFCRQCGADTSQVIDEPAEEAANVDDNKVGSASSAESLPEAPPSKISHVLTPQSRPGLRSAAILLFLMAGFQFANQVINNPG